VNVLDRFFILGVDLMADSGESLEFLLANADDVATPQRGDHLQGEVLSVGPQGLIVDLGLKRDGVVPKEDLERLQKGESPPKVGDKVSVMVVDPQDRDGNLVVSVSQARDSGDWLEAQRLLEADEIIEAAPSAANRGGLIVPFGRLRGFVPASHLSDLPRGLDEGQRLEHLQMMVGRTMPFRVIEVDPQRQRLVLSERKAIRQWRQDQKSRIIKSLQEGEIRKGTVTSLREFGAFVDIGGADGLIHISELSWDHVADPGMILSIGDEIETMVIRLDRQANRIGLSLKRMLPNPWLEAADRLLPGTLLHGTFTRMGASGHYVRVLAGIEGLLAQAPEHPLQPDDQVEVRVLSLDPEKERLDLEYIGPAQAPAAGAHVQPQEEGGESE
jgi:small subunit ribosomal protein S1